MKVVFSNFGYLGLFSIIFLSLFLPLVYVSEFLFFEPYLLFYVAEYEVLNFILVLVICILTGLVLSMSIFRIRFLQASTKKLRTGLLGSIVGAGAGACCGGIGVALISIFGAVGGVATSVLTNFEIPLQIASIVILVFTYFMIVRDLNRECKVNFDKFRD
ncbi:MAG: hypothetical protein H2B05_05460 [Nitrosopumilaceae archaeon]|uniref:Uncharacterized protein n=3 Tax=Candidatus Nitrosomaritimum aestuariumsis TaxID=3342354 RepID=A0AC60W4D5_9ARCH|nr:hypothetical protein [Nitrosopumilaceae archaeon]NCF21382.1 hypothetical protein [Nitrosopumilaceae archaeon]